MTADDLDAPAPPPRRPGWAQFRSSVWFQMILAFVIVGLLLAFVAKPYAVPSGSMETVLQPGDDVLVSRLAYVGSAPGRGDVVVFNADSTWGAQPEENPLVAALRWVAAASGFGPTGTHTLVKRIIATPGQTASCCTEAGQVEVNGHAIIEPYVTNDFAFSPGTFDCSSNPRSLRCFGPVTVPKDAYLVLGDNRAGSSDSAAHCRGGNTPADCWRWMHRGDVVGKVAAVIWPIGRWRAF